MVRQQGRGQTSATIGRNHPVFKTVLCNYWEAGNCKRGEACTFAHGSSELRSYGRSLKDVRPCQFFMLCP